MGRKSRRTLTVSECADELGIAPELLQDYAMRGCPHDKGGRGRSNRFDAAEVAGWMRENGLTGRPGRPVESSPDLDAARLRKENALAAKYEIQVSRERGDLVPLTEVQRFVGQTLRTLRNNLIGLPAEVTPYLVGRDAAEQQAILEDRIHERLDYVADQIETAGYSKRKGTDNEQRD